MPHLFEPLETWYISIFPVLLRISPKKGYTFHLELNPPYDFIGMCNHFSLQLPLMVSCKYCIGMSNHQPVQLASIIKLMASSSRHSSSSKSKLTSQLSDLSSIKEVSSGTVHVSAGGQTLHEARGLPLHWVDLGSSLVSNLSHIWSSWWPDISCWDGTQAPDGWPPVIPQHCHVLDEPWMHHLKEMFSSWDIFHNPAMCFSWQIIHNPQVYIPGFCNCQTPQK